MKNLLSFFFNPFKVSHYLYSVNLSQGQYPTHFATIIVDTNDGEEAALLLVKEKIQKEFNKDPESVEIKFIEKY
jgi:hypothetical protein